MTTQNRADPSDAARAGSVSSEGLSIDNQKVAITYDFAAKVGMIRQVVDIGGTKVTIELEKFEEPKKK